jgi:flagellar capping protein FliD
LKERALRSQYAALDSLVGSLQNTSAFLLQQLG